MEFVTAAVKASERIFGFRRPESQFVAAEETPGSSMNRGVFLAEAKDIGRSRDKRGVASSRGFESCVEALERWQSARESAKSSDMAAATEDAPDWRPPVDTELIGLALSGGGIRSATFCLGALQVLGEGGLLRHVDYLSTVSGGGYIGSFWTCFLARSRAKGKSLADAVVEDADTGKEVKPFLRNPLYKLQHVRGHEESVAFRRLRNYANYLVLGGLWDNVRGPALMIRGLFINFLMVLPYILIAAGVTTLVFARQIRDDALALPGLLGLPLWSFALVIAFLVAVVLSTVLQSLERRGGRASAKSRRLLFLGNMGIVMLALGVICIDWQPRLIHALHYIPVQSPGGAPAHPFSWDSLLRGEFWTSVSAAFGTVSAIVAVLTASRSSGLRAKIALAAVALLVPASFLFLYFLLSGWAVFTPPGSSGWPAWTLHAFTWPTYFVAAVVLLFVSQQFFDVNATSLHNLYRDSLSRTFLFSLQQADDEGETDKGEDDLKLGEVDIGVTGGPYHLLNATVNNPDLGDDALRGRRSDFFVFGPRYSGSNRFGYCPTEKLEDRDKSANLGTALAVSAAAVGPSMGEKTKPLLRFLLAMLNLRLGYWLPSPTAVARNKDVTRVGPLYFFKEMLGPMTKRNRQDDFNTQAYINLSDGGHIENLGIFELLRRRCKYIIAIDAEADCNMTFNGLATLIRLARTDMGIDIDIDVDNLRRDAGGLSRKHWVLGRIDYDNTHAGEILYLKSSVTGTENEYITEYRSRKPDFPHESTSDQFFDEVQFEAYRALGYKVGKSLFPPNADLDNVRYDEMEHLFAELRDRDAGAGHRNEAHFELLDRRRSIDQLLADPLLLGYARELVPELQAAGAATSGPDEEVGTTEPPPFKLHQVCNEQLQLMERALLALRLDDPRNRARHENRGWMNLFRRWSQSSIFQRMWATNVANYSSALQDFCGEELGLNLSVEWQPAPEPRDDDAPGSRYIARVWTLHRGQESPRHQVASATIRNRGDRKILTGFELRAPYTGVGLRERLFYVWAKDPIWSGKPTFDPRSAAILDRKTTVRALLRSHFQPYAEA